MNMTGRKLQIAGMRNISDLQCAILNNTHVLMACLDKDFNFIVVNENYARADGRDADFFVGKNHFSLFPNVENEVIFRRVVDTGEPYFVWAKPFEYVEHPERGVSHWDWSLNPVRDSSGQVSMLVLTLLDVTARVKAEEALMASEARYRMLHETMRDPFVQVNMEGRIIDCNDAYCRMLGYSLDEIRSLTYQQLTPARWHDFESRLVQDQIIFRGYSDIYEKEYIRKDGTVFPVELRTVLARDGSGQPSAMWGIVRDITERKKLEIELKKYNETLEDNVRKRTADLQQLNEALLKSNKELESFAFITSHDLQEPLRMVTSYTQLLARKYENQLDENAKEYIGFAVEGAKRMYDLINGLLHYSRISRKGATTTNVDISKIVDTVKANLAQVIKERNVVITTGKLPVVSADYTQMLQLFQNIIANGIKFSKDKPRIRISSKAEKKQYIFSIKDNGIGIEPQYYNQIFEIFKRLNPRDQFEGTGIGLAICKKIVENHKGRMWIESEPGKGSVFYFTLPKV